VSDGCSDVSEGDKLASRPPSWHPPPPKHTQRAISQSCSPATQRGTTTTRREVSATLPL
jgi:hypothetical protein